MSQTLARIFPQRAVVPAEPEAPVELSRREKAAIIVRLLLAEGAPLPLTALPEHMQAALTEQMASMRMVDRATMEAVVAEFQAELEAVGLAFPGELEGALAILDGHISPSAASRLRRLAGASGKIDPWERIIPMRIETLVLILEEEAVEIGAVLLSKLPVAKAATLLGRLEGEKARRLAQAVSLTSDIDPDAVRRIGLSLLAQLETHPPRAFDRPPAERVGAILTVAPSTLRDRVLGELSQTDEAFADHVRRAIFTFAHIPERLQPRDVARLVRVMDPAVLLVALQGATGALQGVADFLYANLSQRLAENLRDDVAGLPPSPLRDQESAQAEMVEALRRLESNGEITLIRSDDRDP